MKRTRTFGQRRAGFTLVEILIAVAVFAIVLAAINTVFYGALRLRNKTSKAIEDDLPVQQTVSVMKRDLANVVVPGGTLFGPLQSTPVVNATNQMSIGPETGQISPDFYTVTGVLEEATPWAELQKVAYLLVEPTNRIAGRDLVRSITRNLLPTSDLEPKRQYLLSGVESVTFRYFDGYSWDETWDSDSAESPLPQAIRVEIQMAARDRNSPRLPPIEMVVPLMVQARTNAASTTGEGAE